MIDDRDESAQGFVVSGGRGTTKPHGESFTDGHAEHPSEVTIRELESLDVMVRTQRHTSERRGSRPWLMATQSTSLADGNAIGVDKLVKLCAVSLRLPMSDVTSRAMLSNALTSRTELDGDVAVPVSLATLAAGGVA